MNINCLHPHIKYKKMENSSGEFSEKRQQTTKKKVQAFIKIPKFYIMNEILNVIFLVYYPFVSTDDDLVFKARFQIEVSARQL